MNYDELKAKISRSRAGRPKLHNNTYAQYAENGEDIEVVLHDTAIVTAHPDGTFTLNTGGWQTITTKRRINEFSPAQIFQHKWNWYIGNSDTPFENGMRVNAFGMPVRMTSEGQPCPVEW